jgi:glycosyltransferase involved in cell wall biosynthesis
LLGFVFAERRLPVAVIEALAAARPVVATNVGGVADLIQSNETGWLVQSEDVAALSHAIEEAISNRDEATRRGLAGRARVFPALDISCLVRDIEALYLDVLQEKVSLKSTIVKKATSGS